MVNFVYENKFKWNSPWCQNFLDHSLPKSPISAYRHQIPSLSTTLLLVTHNDSTIYQTSVSGTDGRPLGKIRRTSLLHTFSTFPNDRSPCVKVTPYLGRKYTMVSCRTCMTYTRSVHLLSIFIEDKFPDTSVTSGGQIRVTISSWPHDE